MEYCADTGLKYEKSKREGSANVLVTISTAINAYAEQAQQGKRLQAAKQVYQQLGKDFELASTAPTGEKEDKYDDKG